MSFRLLSGFLAAMLLLVVVGFFSWRNTIALTESEKWVAHTHEVLTVLDDLQRRLDTAEAGQRGYLLTGETSFLSPYESSLLAITERLKNIQELINDNPRQQKNLEELVPLINQRLDLLKHRIATRKSDGLNAVATPEVLHEGESTMNAIREVNDRMEMEESRLLQERKTIAHGNFQKTTWIVAAGGFTSVFILAIIFSLLNRENLTRRKSEKALQASELRFRSLVENVRDYAIFMLDPNGMIMTWNAGAERNKGYRAEEIIGKHFSVFYPPEDVQAGKPKRELEMATAEGRTEDEGWRIRKDGSRFWANVVITALRTENGDLYGFSKITRDLSERKAVEEKLRETAEELQRSNAELEQFAYVASHDLQEPLRAVGGCVQILQQRYKDSLDKRANELIQHAVDGAVRMQTLIHDLLAYSRVGSKAQALENIDSAKVLNDALLNLKGALEESHATITYGSLPTVNADPFQLGQLFQNLVGNALKYRSERKPEIHIDTEPHGKAQWRFAIRDNGIGIEPQYFDRIFRLFQRLHTRREYPGTGIGLALCKKIVDRHGGNIWVESQPDKGSTFYFTLPAAKQI